MSWAGKRKFGYFMGFVLALSAVVGVPVFFAVYEAPTCDDGRMNGGERGIDCGGKCARLCSADFSPLRVLWSDASRIVPGVYNVIAYGQNPNATVGAKGISYTFKLYDFEGILVAERKGKATIPAGTHFSVFEGGIRTGERVPVRTTFEFTSDPVWAPERAVTGIKVVTVDTAPAESGGTRSEARVQNELISYTFEDVDATIILYDRDGNQVAFSKTLIESLAPGETETLYFTWPEAVASETVKSEILFQEN